MQRKVAEIMTKNVITINMKEPVTKAISILTQKSISGLAVVDNAGDVVGIISAMDILKLFSGENPELKYTVEEVMTPYTITITPEATLAEAAKLMLENGIHRLIVTESVTKKKPIGIITASDIVRELGKRV